MESKPKPACTHILLYDVKSLKLDDFVKCQCNTSEILAYLCLQCNLPQMHCSRLHCLQHTNEAQHNIFFDIKNGTIICTKCGGKPIVDMDLET